MQPSGGGGKTLYPRPPVAYSSALVVSILQSHVNCFSQHPVVKLEVFKNCLEPRDAVLSRPMVEVQLVFSLSVGCIVHPCNVAKRGKTPSETCLEGRAMYFGIVNKLVPWCLTAFGNTTGQE